MASSLRIVAFGASVGGLEALRTIIGALPQDFPAAVFVTLHVGANSSALPWILERAGSLPAVHPRDAQVFEPGTIYVAPPDHHMVVEAGRKVRLTKGPRENWARPAIDPLFRSAARAYGPAVIGVVLSGGLNDGAAGLMEIKRSGGVAIVQDPMDAFCPEMPRSALANTHVDHVAESAQIGSLLTGLVAAKRVPEVSFSPEEQPMTSEFTLDRPTAVTCPDCGGALAQTGLGTLTQFKCHIGHVYTTEVMLAAQFHALEQSIERALRSLNERAELCRQMAEKSRSAGSSQTTQLEAWEAAQREALEQAEPLRALLTREWLMTSSDVVR
ncbi:MAG TPA: chemotaxis protein CheB [Nitrospiraceae bacterium]|nr:chemotaxis protein CheB [Nitrospiraceae bacterium]